MNDERLREELAALPREQASPGFTGRVMARLAEQQRRRPFVFVPAPAWAAGLALVAVLAGGLWLAEGERRERRAQQLTHLRAEQQRLASELAEIRALAHPAAPVVYLGGDEQTDLVLDLDQLAERVRAGSIQPAGYARPPR
ncbi:MAG TPA: hypothetical protein VF017_05515 [Thermoanaerobaculia bacterium]|nr:hypothetical protein [Thermoanaerobaculia bacterium]